MANSVSRWFKSWAIYYYSLGRFSEKVQNYVRHQVTKVSKCQKKMAEDLSSSDMALNGQLGTKMEKHTGLLQFDTPNPICGKRKSG